LSQERSKPVDPLDLATQARGGKRSISRFRDLVSRSVRLVWNAGRALFVILIGLQILAAATLAGQVLVVESLLNSIITLSEDPSRTGGLWVPAVLLALLTAVTAITGSLQGSIQRLVGERVAQTMWYRVLDVSTGVSLRHFEAPGFFDRLQRVQASATTRPFQVTRSLISIGGALAASIGVGAAIFTLQPILLPLLIIGGVPMLLTSRRESRLEFDFTVRQTPNARLRQYLTWLQTGRDEAKEVRAFNLAPSLRSRLDAAYASYLTDLVRHLRRRSVLNIVGNLASAAVLAGTLVLLMLLIANGQVSVAAAGAAIVAIRMLASQVQILFGGMQQIFECGLFLDDVDDFLRLGPVTVREEGGRNAPAGFQMLTTENVSFHYPGSMQPALKDINITMEAGEIVALVGENGSGKTTLAKILAGLYDPESGAVRWDGIDVREYATPALRDRVAVIFQDFVKYALSAQDNITFGRPEEPFDENRVRSAARIAGAERAIEALPDGYRTPLSRMFAGGHDLSGGQWQKIALARAFYRDSPLVILDEPSAALDPRAEFELFSSLRQLLAGRTALFISHRFATVRNADRIYVLEQGRVVEAGSHEELMTANGQYADLFRLQAAAYLTPGNGEHVAAES
jgi:ATP-binding cassette subfamily B protein